ncbi:MAG: hypothetical protein KKE62_14175 [Proteobacteria bacterium]|nr:hypothetical protein [Pseudomonadota bacterium]MBU1543976.1 hypothetical protein [Pseudomonadota bacterium]MBU2431611.1 hypothetical protein [Pseudomonadota bacterium]MBU2479951.1 hypothetical protein [Pseudomonadota bacterium]
MKYLSAIIFFVSIIFNTNPAKSFTDEITLFDSSSQAVAYIAEELTIYLWSGNPVAYLEEDNAGGFHVYGYNGKHLGWLVQNVVWNHNGKAVGALREGFKDPPNSEPFKSFKQFKPFKAFKEFAPFRPIFTKSWSDTPFKLFLLRGASV